MSRSYKKAPVFSRTGAASERADKQAASQKKRAHFRTALQSTPDLEGFQFNDANHAHSNEWDFAKDGRRFSKELDVRHEGRALAVVNKPRWLQSDRQVHKALAK